MLIDVYDEENFQSIADAYTKAAWNRGTWQEVRWLGFPVLQLPEDLFSMAELIRVVQPDVIVETGVMYGGSTIFYASVLEMLGRGKVVGIDISLASCAAFREHPLARRATLFEGDSVDGRTLEWVRGRIDEGSTVLVALDSDHSRAHVLEELRAYSQLVTIGSYIVVFDGVMRMLADAPRGLPTWAVDNPDSAVQEFLRDHPEFTPDPAYNRLGATFAPGGFLRRIA